ncbi:hypothetical protein RICGR_1338 [Rickettsiella grylli]|uniref:Uncharacterized protein n=2 Tax=Rickettsiella grylli TaxID=59196 RepID=A8PPM1_9COXI|nr:hypothetical protein RICGR_1338 [Rickettsiella grylli]
MQDVDHGREKLYAIVSNEKLADACIEIMQIAAAFQPIQKEEAELLDFFKKDSHWFPLLTEEEQIEVGQRIILHAMNESAHSEEEKLLLAKIFLRKPVSKQLTKQIEVNLLTYEIGCLLRNWQIKKCEQLIQLLNTLTQGVVLPNADPDQLFEWLKIKKRTQSPGLLLTEILVSPCSLNQCNTRSAWTQIKNLTADESLDTLIQKHPDSHWGAVWEKSDPLIQLPKTFRTAILLRDRAERDGQAQTLPVVSSVMERLAKALSDDLQRLKIELEKSHFIYLDKLASFHQKYKEIPETQKEKEHEAGVKRIKQAQRRLHAISSSSNSLFPYLYRGDVINEVEKKQQVATEDDLAHLIYRGVDPSSACSWKSSSSQPYSPSNQLISYFYPDKPNDSRSKAYFYAFNDCEVNALPLFSRLFPSSNQPLALKNTSESPVDIKNSLSIQTILKNPEKVSSMFTQSTALNSVGEKTVQETETVFQQLHDYYVLALTRVEPEYIHSLSFMKQLLCLIRNFFKFGQEIGEERFQSVRIFIGDLCAVLSAKDVDAINQALDELKNNYKDRYQNAERVDKSALYTTMKKAFEGPFLRIINQFTDIDQEEFKLNLEKELQESKLKNKVRSLQKTIVELKQENALTNARLKESYIKSAEDRAEFKQKTAEFKQKTAEFEQKNAVMKADIATIMRSLRSLGLPQQHTDTEVEASASSNHAHFFGSR